MDREARIARRRAIIIIVALATIFLLVVIGLVIMGIRSGKIASEKVLRSEFASMLKNRETMNCTIAWRPSEEGHEQDLGEIPNPTRLTMTFAMEKGGDTFYLDRYEFYGTYVSIYGKGDNVYMWSAVPLLAERGELYDADYTARQSGNIQLTRAQFDKAMPDFFDDLDEFIKNVEPGTEIQCGTGGASSYSEPKNIKDWKKTDE